eukprot:IDg2667t1
MPVVRRTCNAIRQHEMARCDSFRGCIKFIPTARLQLARLRQQSVNVALGVWRGAVAIIGASCVSKGAHCNIDKSLGAHHDVRGEKSRGNWFCVRVRRRRRASRSGSWERPLTCRYQYAVCLECLFAHLCPDPSRLAESHAMGTEKGTVSMTASSKVFWRKLDEQWLSMRHSEFVQKMRGGQMGVIYCNCFPAPIRDPHTNT